MSDPAFVYLHGFASSPRSQKARTFADRLAARGVRIAVPDLNEGEGGFRGLTVTRMIAAVRAAAAGRTPVVLLGSSLGGYVASLYAAREPAVAAVVLMAPAFDFGRRLAGRLAADGESAATRGWFEVFDPGLAAGAVLDYEIVRDALRYEPFPDVRCPALVLHGRRDDAVSVDLSETFARGRPGARLVVLDDDHQLHASVDRMWNEMEAFLRPWLPGVPDQLGGWKV